MGNVQIMKIPEHSVPLARLVSPNRQSQSWTFLVSITLVGWSAQNKGGKATRPFVSAWMKIQTLNPLDQTPTVFNTEPSICQLKQINPQLVNSQSVSSNINRVTEPFLSAWMKIAGSAPASSFMLRWYLISD